MDAKICRHCHLKHVARPRGLCWCCYYAPSIRRLYAPACRYGRRGVGVRGKDPCDPTAAMPGTPEKIAVLAERARFNQRLWHPEDPVLETPRPFYLGVHLNPPTHGFVADLARQIEREDR